MNIFVGNLSFDATEEDLKKLFEGFGSVSSVVIVLDEKGNKSRGFGFIEISDSQQALKAITALDGQIFMGRPMRVNPTQPKSEKVRVEKRHVVRMRDSKEEKKEFLGGRRTYNGVRLSAAKRREQPKHWEKREVNEKPWKKREAAAKPWEKRESGAKPWEKRESGKKTWQKREPGAKPWQKREAGAKPWKKREAAAKPWEKRESGAKSWQKREPGAKPWKNTKARTKPLKRTTGKSRPWEKRPGVAKPYQR